MLTVRVLSVLATLSLACACGDESGGGGSSGGSGGTGAGGAGTSTAGGNANSSGGNANSSGGNANAGGATAVSTAAAALAACATWPASKLLPLVGPFFYGPDPGPCSSSSSTGTKPERYSYDADGLLTSYDTGVALGTQVTLTWDAGKLLSLTATGDQDYSTSFLWGDGYVIETGETQVVRYELTTNGYPLTATITAATFNGTATYEYEDCRMVGRQYVTTEATENTTYTYDSAGHLATRTTVETGAVQTFDYSCWQ